MLWPIALAGVITTPIPEPVDGRTMIFVAALSWPGLALLGAVLAPSAIGSRTDAIATAIAMGIGAPLAAITSALIAVAIIAAISSTGAQTGAALGLTIRLGVLGAMRCAPFVAIAVAVWLYVIRRRGVLAAG